MARRNKVTRVQRRTAGATNSNRNPRETAEDAEQRRKFFLWTGIITALVVLLIYFVLFD